MIFIFVCLSGILLAATNPAVISSLDTKSAVKELNKLDISIDAVHQGKIVVYVTDAQFRDLKARGYQISALPNQAKDYADQLWQETRNSDNPLRDYYSYDEYVTFMQDTASQYPGICHLYDIGTTPNNHHVYYMKISDNVNTEENEPEVKYASSMHGDEVVGFDMMIRLIQLLTSQYGTDDRITQIVNNTELLINPLFNPDGYVLHQRENAAGVDCNRHFPDYISDHEN
jgi:murein tripeptide amidase MpaA